MALQLKNTSADLFISVNLDYFANNPVALGKYCYELRMSLSDTQNVLVSKSFFANLLNCNVVHLAHIENGYVEDFALALRYLRKLIQVINLFNS